MLKNHQDFAFFADFFKFELYKKYDYSSVKRLLKKFRETGSMDRGHGSGRPRTVSTGENMDLIEELVCSQETRSHTHLAPRKITEQTGISRSSIRRMVKKETLNNSST